KCLEGPREYVLDEITEWAQQTSRGVICWVYGPAGSGKSTIARSIADRFLKRAATFAFSRNSKELMTNKNFFPTIAYHLATLFPFVQEGIETTLTNDQLILSKGLSSQLDMLILQPLRAPSLRHRNVTVLIIVDGLDECN
ncbi:hypothetical protein K435DRAFT_556440, partial [Dendrothele bispora CBS 962.96]